jgi:small-conductance mechanosensitive channel
MKRSLLFLFGNILILGNLFAVKLLAAGVEKEKLVESPIKSIKVSELNANFFSAIYDFLKDTGSALFEGFFSLKDFVETGEWLVISLQACETRPLMEAFGIHLIIAFLIALAISQVLSFWLTPKIHDLLRSKEQTSPQKRKRLFQAALLSIVSPLSFGFFLYTIFRLINPHDVVYLEAIWTMSSGAVTIWILLNLAHVFLKPLTPEHQHIPLAREVLATTYVWIWRISIVALFGFFVLQVGDLIQLPVAGKRLFLQGSCLIIAILTIMMMLTLYEEVNEWIKKQKSDSKLSPVKKAMLPYLKYSYIPIIVFIVISYMSWVTPKFDRFQIVMWKSLLTLSVFPVLRLLVFCLRSLRIVVTCKYLRHFSHFLARRAIFYGRQIDFMIIVLLNITALVVILDLWGLNPSYFIFSKMGRLIAEKAFSIFMIITVALFITRTGNDLLSRYLSEDKGLNEAEKQRAARFKTISSVSRNVLRIAIWTPAILLILVELGVEIIPILATVGILAAGLSFGVQSLVKDLVTGFFMLLEDAFAVGDLVVINGQMGRIESLTVRVVRLRATDGALYTFPYGNITSLCNQNRDFSAAVMLFRVGLETDLNQVFGILEKITTDLQKDKKTRSLVVGPIEIDGVNEVSDHSLEIRAVLKTKPGQHYKVKWAFNRLLKQYLELNKIPAANPRHISYNYTVEK